jgi:hypothetical protein
MRSDTNEVGSSLRVLNHGGVERTHDDGQAAQILPGDFALFRGSLEPVIINTAFINCRFIVKTDQLEAARLKLFSGE